MNHSALVALLIVVAPAGAFAGNVEEWIAAGDEALTNIDLEKAALAYKRALKIDPKNYEACWRLARATVDQGTLETDVQKQRLLYLEAKDYARASVRFNPKGSKGHVYLAVVLGKLALFHGGRTKVELSKEVKTEAEKAVELDPKEDLGYHVLGVWNREMVELNWFLKKFAEALYGSFPSASIEDALKHLRHAAELAPHVVPHQVELGATLAAAGKWAEAKQTLEHALAMPKTWVTDDVYKEQAGKTLESVKRHAQ